MDFMEILMGQTWDKYGKTWRKTWENMAKHMETVGD